jgi:hypothetical protein
VSAEVTVTRVLVRHGGITIPVDRLDLTEDDRWAVGTGVSRFDRVLAGYDDALAYARQAAEILERARLLREIAQEHEDAGYSALVNEWNRRGSP